ncbi:MAG: FecR domain-containing protein [Candidatus Eisenbacteria bacterium]|nr:FecR domain-containing protein [Candidatus Eisenbacteria bacterium]
MAKNRDDERIGAEDQEARDAVRSLPDVPAAARFRREAAQLFASGRLGPVHADPDFDVDAVASAPPFDESADLPGELTGGASSSGVPASIGVRSTGEPASTRLRPTVVGPRRSWLSPVFGTLAAAAVILILVTLFRPTLGEAWEVVAVSGSGSVSVNDRMFDVGDVAESRLEPGARVRTEGDVVLELVHDGLYALELGPNTDMTLPTSRDGRLFAAEVRNGMATCVTGPRFPGSMLRITAPDADVEVHGTTFAVLADAEKTCISVLEGAVDVRTHDGNVCCVQAGRCKRFYRAPDPHETEESLSDGQVANLTHWQGRSHSLLGAQGPGTH